MPSSAEGLGQVPCPTGWLRQWGPGAFSHTAGLSVAVSPWAPAAGAVLALGLRPLSGAAGPRSRGQHGPGLLADGGRRPPSSGPQEGRVSEHWPCFLRWQTAPVSSRGHRHDPTASQSPACRHCHAGLRALHLWALRTRCPGHSRSCPPPSITRPSFPLCHEHVTLARDRQGAPRAGGLVLRVREAALHPPTCP